MKLGFGEMSVEEVCNAHRVNTDFFLEIANAYLDEDYVPGEGLSLFSLGTVVKYLTSTHTYYVETALPQVEEKYPSPAGSFFPFRKGGRSGYRFFQ